MAVGALKVHKNVLKLDTAADLQSTTA
jgi:hypothetical protein